MEPLIIACLPVRPLLRPHDCSNSQYGFAYGNVGAIECVARMKRSAIRDGMAGLPPIAPRSIEAMLKRMAAKPKVPRRSLGARHFPCSCRLSQVGRIRRTADAPESATTPQRAVIRQFAKVEFPFPYRLGTFFILK